MWSLPKRVATTSLAATAVLALAAQPVGASHAGATVDCGDAGTFILQATEVPSGLQQPDPAVVTVFKEGGTLAMMEFWVNGELIFSAAGTGRAHRKVDEVTCTYTTGLGSEIVIKGILTAP
jgi:hypothetical protein